MVITETIAPWGGDPLGDGTVPAKGEVIGITMVNNSKTDRAMYPIGDTAWVPNADDKEVIS